MRLLVRRPVLEQTLVGARRPGLARSPMRVLPLVLVSPPIRARLPGRVGPCVLVGLLVRVRSRVRVLLPGRARLRAPVRLVVRVWLPAGGRLLVRVRPCVGDLAPVRVRPCAGDLAPVRVRLRWRAKVTARPLVQREMPVLARLVGRCSVVAPREPPPFLALRRASARCSVLPRSAAAPGWLRPGLSRRRRPAVLARVPARSLALGQLLILANVPDERGRPRQARPGAAETEGLPGGQTGEHRRQAGPEPSGHWPGAAAWHAVAARAGARNRAGPAPKERSPRSAPPPGAAPRSRRRARRWQPRPRRAARSGRTTRKPC